MTLVLNIFSGIWNRMEGRRNKSLKGGPIRVGGGGCLGYLAVQGKYGCFYLSLPLFISLFYRSEEILDWANGEAYSMPSGNVQLPF